MMKQCILVLLLPFVSARRSCPPVDASMPKRNDLHRMGWGLDEEFFDCDEVDYESVKPVKRVVASSHGGTDDEHDEKKPFLWGISKVSDLDDLMEE